MLKQAKLKYSNAVVRSIIGILFIATAFYLAAPTAKASNPAPGDVKSFANLDINLDGYVDQKEAGAFPALLKGFDSADIDKDARLSPAEYAKAFSAKP